MDRRTFMGLVSGGVLTGPLAAEAQQAGKVYRIGLMLYFHASASQHLLDAFRQALRELGWVEGKNIEFEILTAEGKSDPLPAMAAELVRRRVDVIIALVRPFTEAAKKATSTIPIAMVTVGDPVGSGLVESLARPGGNITGLSVMTVELTAKALQILKEAIPRASRVSALQSWVGPSPVTTELERAAQFLGIQLQVVVAPSPEAFDEAFSTMIRGRSDALIVHSSPVFFLHQTRLVELAAKARLPAIFSASEYAQAGGLMAYAPNFLYHFRRAAVYVDKILKGAKPADLPIEQPTKFELVINLKTAKALGLTIPQSLLLRADEVIQ
jgi:putative ABC transport system substrate-binding protein